MLNHWGLSHESHYNFTVFAMSFKVCVHLGVNVRVMYRTYSYITLVPNQSTRWCLKPVVLKRTVSHSPSKTNQIILIFMKFEMGMSHSWILQFLPFDANIWPMKRPFFKPNCKPRLRSTFWLQSDTEFSQKSGFPLWLFILSCLMAKKKKKVNMT